MSLKIGVTGGNGFLGYHIINTIKYTTPDFKVIDLQRTSLTRIKIDEFTSACDIIIHLAAVNRDLEKSKIMSVNIELAKNLISSIKRTSFSGKPFSLLQLKKVTKLSMESQKNCKRIIL